MTTPEDQANTTTSNQEVDNKETTAAEESKMAPNNETESVQPKNEEEVPLKQGDDDVQVKIVKNDANLEAGGDPSKEDEFRTMTKAELMKYAEDPFWVKLRWALFILFWVAWAGMLVASIVIIILAPKCPSPQPKEWWQKGSIYQIHVKSFKDTNADGSGDFKGIESKIEYLNDIQVGSVLLSSIFDTDYKDVNPEYGNLEDFKALVSALHNNYIKVIIDIKNPNGIADIEDVINFWLDIGVDGFQANADSSDNNFMEVLKKIRSLLDKKTEEDSEPRVLISDVPNLSVEQLYGFYGSVFTDENPHSGDIAQIPLNLVFTESLTSAGSLVAENLKYKISDYLDNLPAVQAWPNFILSNSRMARSASRFGHEYVDAMNMINMLLPGTPFTYYGDEIGMTDADEPQRFLQNNHINPMQWNTNENGGFTSGPNSWMKVNKNYKETTNVDSQQQAQYSHLNVYKQLAKIRTHQSILFGSTDFYANNTLFSFNRVRKGNPGYLVAINFGNEEIHANVTSLPYLPESGNVHSRSFHSKAEDPETTEGTDSDEEALWSNVNFDSLRLLPKEGIVVTFIPKM